MPQKLTKLEEEAIKLLLKHQEKGLLQSELWHKLGVTSREGSRIAIRLEKKGMVKRVKEFAKDRWTRRLVPLIPGLQSIRLKMRPVFPVHIISFVEKKVSEIRGHVRCSRSGFWNLTRHIRNDKSEGVGVEGVRIIFSGRLNKAQNWFSSLHVE